MLPVREAPNHFHAQATPDVAIAAHGAVRTDGAVLWKIASDLRLMGMGPRAGDRRAGAARDAARLLDHAGEGEPGDHRVADHGRGPRRRQRRDDRVRSDRAVRRAQRHAAGDRGRAPRVDRAAGGGRSEFVGADHRRARGDRSRPALVEQGLMLATALAPVIGYDEAAKLAKEAFRSGRTIRELALERDVAGRPGSTAGPRRDDWSRAGQRGRRGRLSTRAFRLEHDGRGAGAGDRPRPRRRQRASGRNAGRRIARRVGHEAPQSDAGPRRACDEPGPPGAG